MSKINSATPWVVQKFGGTSVGKFPLNIADIIKMYSDGHRVVAVCSARSTGTKAEGTTTRLLKAGDDATRSGDYMTSIEAIRKDHLSAAEKYIKDETIRNELKKDVELECDDLTKILAAAKVIDEISPRTLDTIMSAGEKLSCIYMSAILNDQGVPAKYVDLSRVLPSDFNAANGLDRKFYSDLTKGMVKALDLDAPGPFKVPVVTGFFGIIPGGLLNGVGRGYTDLCAALLAVGLEAEELQIWKEVDGIFTADPRKVPTARLLDRITPEEASELTYYGSEVIHPFTMEQVIRARIPIRIKNIMNAEGAGTIIFPDNNSKRGEETPPHPPVAVADNMMKRLMAAGCKLPTAVTTKSNIIVLNVHSNKKKNHSHGFLAQVFTILDRWRLVVDLISTSEVHISMALHSTLSDSSLGDALAELEDYGSVDVTKKLCIVSLVGKQMKQSVGTAGRMFTVLADANINIEMISQGASEINISCVIEEKDAVKALNVLHSSLLGGVSETPATA